MRYLKLARHCVPTAPALSTVSVGDRQVVDGEPAAGKPMHTRAVFKQ